jgi:hypothetical protein
MDVSIKLSYPLNDARNLDCIKEQLRVEEERLINSPNATYSDLYVFLSVTLLGMKSSNGGLCFKRDVLSSVQIAWLKDLSDRFNISEDNIYLWVNLV